MKNVLVFFGGKSCEHDISIITGVLAVNSIDKELFNAIPIYVDKNGEWFTGECLKDIEWYKNKDAYKTKLTKVTFISGDDSLYSVTKNKIKPLYKIAVALNCMHGVNGEDGSLSGCMKLHNIPFSSPDIFASSFAIDKDFTKIVLSGLNVEKLPYARIFKNSYYLKKQSVVKMIEKKFGYPVIIKPATLGSSIGIEIAKSSEKLESCLDNAFKYDEKVIVEKALENFKEINCAAYRDNDKIIVSECEEPITSSEILSFKDKYLGSKGGATKKFPAEIPDSLRCKIRSITEKVYRKADVNGVIRIDYIVSNNKVYLNEVNTVPGSLAYYLFSDTIKGFTAMLTQILNDGISKHLRYMTRDFSYNSVVLKDVKGIKGGKTRR